MHGFNLDWVIETIIDLKTQVEEFVSQDFETKTFITNNRKLSEDGNLTGKIQGVDSSEYLTKTGDFKGTIHSKDSSELIAEVDSNGDQIAYLTNQFADGQTGLVVDGGFFGDDEIDKNYDGGVW